MKHIIKIMIVALAIVSLAGCGNEEEQTTSPIIINVGDSSTKKETTEENTNATEELIVDNTNNEIGNNDNNANTESEESILVGVWATAQGDIIEFSNDNSFNGFLVAVNEFVNGTYETDESTYIELTYITKVTIENPTDEQLILQNGLEEKEINTKYIIKEISKPTEETNKSLILVNNSNNEELSFFEYVNSNTETIETEDDNTKVEILSDEDAEKIKQELIDSGINPETGLSFEDEQKLIESGIDPSTGKPFEEGQNNSN